MLQQTQQSKPLNGMLMRCVLTRSASPAAMKVPSLLPASDTFRQWSRLPSDLANSKSSATTYLLLQMVREHYNKLLCSLGGRATPVHYRECRKRMRALHTNRPSIEVGPVEPMQPAYYVLLLPKEISRCHPAKAWVPSVSRGVTGASPSSPRNSSSHRHIFRPLPSQRRRRCLSAVA